MRRTTNRLLLAAALVATAALAACSTTKSSVSDASPWLVPTPALRQQIEDEARRLPWTHGMERLEQIQWFAHVGEPAYPTLLAMVSDPRKDVAGSALAALGATKDSRLVEHLRAVPWPDGSVDPDLALERARTLLRLGDWQVVPTLVRGLRDERMVTRALCIQALEEATHERLGFDPRGEPADREAAARRWEAWARERLADPLLNHTAAASGRPQAQPGD
jgi:HEAT repeat protein